MKYVVHAIWGLALCGAAGATFGPQSGGRDILREQRDIREQAESATGKYSRFNPEASATLERAQRTIFNLLGESGSQDALGKDDKVKLFNAVETVKAVIAGNDEDRLVCTREPRLGTHMRETVCATVRERQTLLDGARDFKGKGFICSQGPGQAGCGTRD